MSNSSSTSLSQIDEDWLTLGAGVGDPDEETPSDHSPMSASSSSSTSFSQIVVDWLILGAGVSDPDEETPSDHSPMSTSSSSSTSFSQIVEDWLTLGAGVGDTDEETHSDQSSPSILSSSITAVSQNPLEHPTYDQLPSSLPSRIEYPYNIPSPNLPANNTQWDITKTLTDSDVGSHSRLLIHRRDSYQIMIHLSYEEVQCVYSSDGLRIKVLDVDTMSEVPLIYKVLSSSGAHVFNGQWIKEFVRPRGLRRGSVIGLRFWKQPGMEGKLLFKVLSQ